MYFVGRFIGYIIFLFIVNPMRFVFGRMECVYHNTEELLGLKGKPFLVVANHIKPRSRFLRGITMPYDAYIMRKMFATHGIQTTAFTSYDSVKRAKSKIAAFFKHYIKEPLIKGIVLSIDLIPLNRRVQDKTTRQDLKKRIQKGAVGIGIFPEGTWFDKFDPDRKLLPGMSIFGKRYDLPILPIYLNAYDLDAPIDIRIGKLINSSQDSKIVVARVKEQFKALHESDWDIIHGSPKNQKALEYA